MEACPLLPADRKSLPLIRELLTEISKLITDGTKLSREEVRKDPFKICCVTSLFDDFRKKWCLQSLGIFRVLKYCLNELFESIVGLL